MKTISPNDQSLTFEHLNLHASLLNALAQCGYTSPTPIQAQAIPEVLAGQDVIASAQTGTGKTAAFLLPALHHLLTKPATHKKPRILILSPTRELAQQIEKSARDYSRNIRMSSVCLVGGMPYPQQVKALSRPLDLIIATPGRLIDHLERNRVDLSAIELLVLDEADRMLDMGFVEDVEMIAQCCNKQRQTMLFSATIDRQMENLSKALLKNPVRIKVEAERTNNRQIQQSVYLTDDMQHKMAILNHILQQESIFKGIIFTATKSAADDLADELYEQGYKAAAMHGDMKQTRRNKTLEQLRNGRLQLIIATDVAARGIDVNNITHVINFDMPRFAEDYVHRIGRTGRAGQLGCAMTFVTHAERSFLQKIEKYIGQTIAWSVIEGLEPKVKAEKAKSKTSRRSDRNGSYAAKSGFSKRGTGGKGSFARSKTDRNETRKSNSYYSAEEGKNTSGRRAEAQPKFARHAEDRSDSRRSYAAGGRPASSERRSDAQPKFARHTEDREGRRGNAGAYAAGGRPAYNERYTEGQPRFAGRKDEGRKGSGFYAAEDARASGGRRFEERAKLGGYARAEHSATKKTQRAEGGRYSVKPGAAKASKPKLSLKNKRAINY